MRVDATRIAALLAPFLQSHPDDNSEEGAAPSARRPAPGALSPQQLAQLSTYLDLLLRWNARMNLTAVREPEEIVTRHFGESLFAAQHLLPSGQLPLANYHLLDLGSGAGFPGLPVKIWAPAIRLTLIESRQRKATFLKEVIRALGLNQAAVFAGRAEQHSEPPADLVTLRAVERFEDVLPVAARLVDSGGRLALLVGASQVTRAQELVRGFEWAESQPIPGSAARVLLVGRNQARQASRE